MSQTTKPSEIEEKSNVQLVEEIEKSFKDRFLHPVILSYIISWSIVNWRFIMFLIFSDVDVLEKLEPNCYNNYINFWGWIYPFAGIFIYYLVPDTVKIGMYGIKKISQIFKGLSWTKTDELTTYYTDLEKIYNKRREMINAKFTTEKLEQINTENTRLKSQIGDLNVSLDLMRNELADSNKIKDQNLKLTHDLMAANDKNQELNQRINKILETKIPLGENNISSNAEEKAIKYADFYTRYNVIDVINTLKNSRELSYVFTSIVLNRVLNIGSERVTTYDSSMIRRLKDLDLIDAKNIVTEFGKFIFNQITNA